MEPTRCVAANKVGTCSDEHGSFEKWIMRSLGMTLCQTRAGAGDIPLVIPATMSPTYEQGQVRDAMITHLPLFSFGHHATRAALATLAHCRQWAALVGLCPTSAAT